MGKKYPIRNGTTIPTTRNGWPDEKYNPSGDITDNLNAYGYGVAHTLIGVLRACGDNLTREERTKRAVKIDDDKPPLGLLGVVISTSAEDFAPIKQMQLIKFNGMTWKLFGELISGATN